MPERLEQLKHWLESELDFSEYTLNPASADASFRRYFRVIHKGESLIVMDAPPEKEDSRPFVDISRMFFDVGLNVPAVIDEDLQQGFLLLSDLGSQPYLGALNNDSVDVSMAMRSVRWPRYKVVFPVKVYCRAIRARCCCLRWNCFANGCLAGTWILC